MNMKTSGLSRYLSAFEKRFHENGMAAAEQQVCDEEARKVQAFTKSRILSMTEEDLFEYLSPLWAMAMWGNKHYQVDNIIESNGMDVLRKQLANLVYGESDIEKRWDDFRSKVKGIGPAIMSELLCKAHTDKYLLWNKKTYTGFKALGVEKLPRYDSALNGKIYARLSGIGREIVSEAVKQGFKRVSNMLELNSFIWKELQHVPELSNVPDAEEKLQTASKKEATFIHNDIRDKVAEIGRCLGFRAEVEKKVADGAVVDAIWEVTIGNMGRVIYVFEVQTSGSIDSLILNLMKARNNKAVQGIVAVTDRKQIEKIKKELSSLAIKDEVRFWDYTEVMKVHESLQYVNEAINRLELVPVGL